MAKPSRNPITEISAKLRLANRLSGRIGSGTRRSTTANAPSASAASTARPRICGEIQSYSLPPHVVTSTIAVMPTDSSAAPSQSILCSVRYFGRCMVVARISSATPPSGRLT